MSGGGGDGGRDWRQRLRAAVRRGEPGAIEFDDVFYRASIAAERSRQEEQDRKLKASADTRRQTAEQRWDAIRNLLADSRRQPSAAEVARRLAALHSDDCPAGCGHVNPQGKPWSGRTIRGDLAALRSEDPASS